MKKIFLPALLLLLAAALAGCGTLLVEDPETLRIGSALVGLFT